MNPVSGSILVVENESLVAELLADMLREMGLDVCATAASAEDAIALAQRHKPNIVLMDVSLNGSVDGVEAATTIRQLVGTRVIFLTGSREPATVKRIEADHTAILLYKPIHFNQLRKVVMEAIA